MSDIVERAAYQEDVMKAAREIAAEMQPAFEDKIRAGLFDDRPHIQAAARAIIAERERCARIAAVWVRRAMHLSPDGYEIERRHRRIAEEAAAAIRKGEAS